MKYSFSIVSHNQQHLCKTAIASIVNNLKVDYEIILTLNTKEKLSISSSQNYNLSIIQNIKPLGFGTNHNNAFKLSKGDYFVIVNPDVELIKWDELNLESRTLYSPVILNLDGTVADYQRSYPTIINLFRRKFLVNKSEKLDWFAGIFLIINRSFFKELKGFNEEFFMYLEDTDLSIRVKKIGGGLKVLETICVYHDARRDSNKNLNFFKYHILSLLKFYTIHANKILF